LLHAEETYNQISALLIKFILLKNSIGRDENLKKKQFAIDQNLDTSG